MSAGWFRIFFMEEDPRVTWSRADSRSAAEQNKVCLNTCDRSECIMARSLQVKTLKGESFKIEVAPEAVVSKSLIHAAI